MTHLSLQLASIALGAVQVGQHPAQGLRVPLEVVHGLLDLGGEVLGDGRQLGAAVLRVVGSVAVGTQSQVTVQTKHGVDVVGVVARAALGQRPVHVLLLLLLPPLVLPLPSHRCLGGERLHLVAGRLHLQGVGAGTVIAQVLLAVGAVHCRRDLPSPLLAAGGAVGGVTRGRGQGRTGQTAGQDVVRQLGGTVDADLRAAFRAGVFGLRSLKKQWFRDAVVSKYLTSTF